MTQNRIASAVRGQARPLVAAVAVLSGSLLASACASVPDAANPAHWYRSTVDYFSGDDKSKRKDVDKAKKETEAKSGPAAERGQPPPGADQPFPKLSSVPERPQRQVAQGLVADPNRPRYAPAIPRQTEDAPPSSGAATAPAPAPQAPVAAAPSAPPRVATAPAPARALPVPAAPAPPPAVARPMTVEEAYRASLAQQQLLPSQLAAASAAAGGISPIGDTSPTVVVSSGGVVMDAPMVAAAQAPTVARSPAPPSPPVLSPVGPARAAPTAPTLGMPTRDAVGGGAGPTPSSVKIATVLFPNGSSQVDGRGQQVLAQVAHLHRQNGGKLRVVGHASSRTRAMDPGQHDRVNLNVSAARANAVASELVRLGARPENVLVSAVADSDPLYFEVMPTGEAGNRRAEVYIDR